MSSFRQRVLSRVVGLSIRLTGRHRRIREEDFRRADMAPPPTFGFSERLRDFFRRRWLKVKK